MVGACASAENFRADRQMNFIHQTGAEQRVVQFAAAFAQKPFHAPFRAQPAQRCTEIDFVLPQIFTSSARARSCVSFFADARSVVSTMIGENRF